MQEIRVLVQQTPNPNALKFIVNRTLKTEGKATITSLEQAEPVPLARELFTLPGVTQLHFHDNFVTVTFSDEIDPFRVQGEVEAILTTRLALHNANFELSAESRRQPRELTPELEKIEEILDRTIRPGLRADGGDIEAVSLEGNVLLVSYEGACGTCPSATMGTLEAIRGILADEFNPEIQVYTV